MKTIILLLTLFLSSSLFSSDTGSEIKSIIPESLAGYKLHELSCSGRRKDILGKSYIISGMISKISVSKNSARLDLFENRITCQMKDPQSADIQNLADFYVTEKKEYSNRTSKYRDFYIKVAVYGQVARSIKPNSLNLINCELVFWYGYRVTGATSKRLLFRRIAGSENIKFKGRINLSSPPSTDLQFLNGYVYKSGLRMNNVQININKKMNIEMYYDPLSFATEVHVIDTILRRKRFSDCLDVKMLAELTDNRNDDYKNGVVLDWKATGSHISLYPPVYNSLCKLESYRVANEPSDKKIDFAHFSIDSISPKKSVFKVPSSWNIPKYSNLKIVYFQYAGKPKITVQKSGVVLLLKRGWDSTSRYQVALKNSSHQSTIEQLMKDGWKVSAVIFNPVTSSVYSVTSSGSGYSSLQTTNAEIYYIFSKECKVGETIYYEINGINGINGIIFPDGAASF